VNKQGDGHADWLSFTTHVLVKSAPAWADLPGPDERAAAVLLGFTPELWGRQWALLERIFHGNVGIMSWEDVADVASERAALEVFGWNQSYWNGEGGLVAPANAAMHYTKLLPQQKAALVDLRITEQQWNDAWGATVEIKGCFWHKGTFSVTDTKRAPGRAETPQLPPKPVCKNVDETVWAVCGADGTPFKYWGVGAEGAVAAVRNCQHAVQTNINGWGERCPLTSDATPGQTISRVRLPRFFFGCGHPKHRRSQHRDARGPTIRRSLMSTSLLLAVCARVLACVRAYVCACACVCAFRPCTPTRQHAAAARRWRWRWRWRAP